MSRKFLVPVGLPAYPSDPTGTFSSGDTYFNTGIQGVKTYNGTSWITSGGAQGVQGTTGTTGAGGALAYYGSFYDTTTQTASSTTTAYVVNIGSQFEANGVSIVSGNQLTFSHAGTYNIQYSFQFNNSDVNSDNVDVWIRKNGTDVADSNSIYNVPGTSHGGAGALIAAVNYVITLNAGDYIQFAWAVSSTTISIATSGAQTGPTVPITPGVIVTATQVMYTVQGTQGTTGSTGATGSQGTTGTQGATGLQGIVTTGPGLQYVSGVIQLQSPTGTGNNVVLDTNAVLVTPNIGAATGTSVVVTGSLQGTSHVTTGGTSAQFVKGNGTLDNTTYLTGTTGVTTVNGSSGAITNIAVTNANNSFSVDQSIDGVTVGKGNNYGTYSTAIGNGALTNAGTGINVLGTITGGTGYTAGTYTNVTLTYVSGTAMTVYPKANITISGGSVSTVTLTTTGLGGNTTTVLSASAASIGGTGSGFSVPVLAMTNSYSYNTAIGYSAMASYQGNYLTGSNTAVGSNSLNYNTTGYVNSAVGVNSLHSNTTGYSNSAVGYGAGYNNTSGSENIFIGDRAGYSLSTSITTLGTITGGSGYTNGTYTGVMLNPTAGTGPILDPTATIVVSGGAVTSVTLTNGGAGGDTTTVLSADPSTIGGTGSGFSVPVTGVSAAGGNNVFVGSLSGYSNGSGIGNVFIGYQAGYNETGSNKLYIANSTTSTPLIGGDFSAKTVSIQGTLTTSGNITAAQHITSGGTSAQFVMGNGSLNNTTYLTGTTGVTTFSAGTTGLTPSTGTSGAVTLAGTLNVANGGTGTGTAGITAFNNITGYTASGSQGTTSTAVVFSGSPTITTPTLVSPLHAAGTATAAPLRFTPTSAVLLTTPAAGNMEVDSSGNLYYSPSTTRYTVPLSTTGNSLIFTTSGATTLTLPTSGTVLTSAAVTAKGDILVGTASGAITNQAVGTGRQTLVPDSTQTDGLRWGDDNNILTIMGAYI